jgi:hypothetical protein
MQLQTNAVGEAAPKRKRRMRRREWRKKWLVMSEGTRQEARAIKQLMRGPNLLKSAMPRVIPDVDKLKEQGAVVGPYSSWTKFVPSRTMGVNAVWNDAYAGARLKGLDIAASEALASNTIRETFGKGREFGRKYHTHIFKKYQSKGGKLFAKKPGFTPDVKATEKMVTNSDSPFKTRKFKKVVTE